MKHLLSIEAMEPKSIENILENAVVMKAQRGDSQHQPLAGQTWALMLALVVGVGRLLLVVGVNV